MNDPAPPKVRRVSELPREIPPPNDGWPALEARLRESGRPQSAAGALPGRKAEPARYRRPRFMQITALAAVLAAVFVGVSLDRWVLSPTRPVPQSAGIPHVGTQAAREWRWPMSPIRGMCVSEQELLRTLDARLAKLPPPTRQKVLQSLTTIHQSMQQIQQALGREPGNALLQELLIDTYQNEMQVLSTVQQASGGAGET